jgi:hypothetical protein
VHWVPLVLVPLVLVPLVLVLLVLVLAARFAQHADSGLSSAG